MPPEPNKRLSHRLLALALGAALLVGLLSSLVQIAHQVQQIRQDIQRDGTQILAMFREPSSQALLDGDSGMARRVVEGLLQHPGVSQASLRDNRGNPLAAASQAVTDQPRSALSDRLFGRQYLFGVPLYGPPPLREQRGELSLTLDTHYQAAAFLDSARLSLLSSLARALLLGGLLYLLYRWQLTGPLQRLLADLERIDPDRPGTRQLQTPRGHEDDELGQWVERANRLLASVARHSARHREAENTLQRLSQVDQLTGLPNRVQLQEQLEQILVDAQGSLHRVAIFCLGLDDFKAVNERHGYQSGDQLLRATANRLRVQDCHFAALARMGSDQFALILIAFEHPGQAAELAQRLLDDLARPFLIGQQEIALRASLGIALFPEDGHSAEYLLQRAEQTMTLAKQQARSGYQFYVASVDQQMRQQRELEHDLRSALANGELEVHYQPQIAYTTQQVIGVEALLRWRHPQHGLVSPERFIPLAEQSGLILKIGDWVLEQACRQLSQWHAEGLHWLRMAVNLSTAQLCSPGLPQRVLELTRHYGLPARSLELEITETVLMGDIGSAARQLSNLREAQVLVAIDDFGTGYSSLNYLNTLPLDKIKIDKSFVRELGNDDADPSIIKAIIQLAHSLNIEVIAEGVENRAQEACLIAQGCSEGQGFLYSRPLPAAQIAHYIRHFEQRRKAQPSDLPARG